MWRRFEKIPFLLLCAVGFLLGCFVAVLVRGKGSVLAPDNLCRMKGMILDQGAYAYDVIKLRGGMVLFIIIAGTTYLAPTVCMLSAVWIGMSLGCFQTMAIAQYGLKGILLLPAAAMPQFLAYLPAFFCLLKWSTRLYHAIYKKQNWKKGSALSGLILILAAFACGIFMECRIAPGTLQQVLQAF